MKYSKCAYMKVCSIVFFLMILFIILLLWSSSINSKAKQINFKQEVKIIYFFSPTCSSCKTVSNILYGIEQKYSNVKIDKYNITDLENKSLLNNYCNIYNVPADISGIVPIVFVRESYLYDKDEIKNGLETILLDDSQGETVTLEREDLNYTNDQKIFSKISIVKLVISAFLNGLNPCSFSMLIFLIMLLECKHERILQLGLLFCLGKFLSFVLLGTIFYKVMAMLNSSYLVNVINLILIVILLVLCCFNLYDYFVIKSENLGQIRAQLPSGFRKFNHNFMKKGIETFADSKCLGAICFLIGIIIALTEFLCSGQIYLVSIVTVMQTNSPMFSQAFMYLIFYSLICTMPLIIVVLIIAAGKRTLEISNLFIEKIQYIKLIYAALFGLLAVALVVQLVR